MSEINDGGPAFTSVQVVGGWGDSTGRTGQTFATVQGMSLRDYFAGKAMQSLIATRHYEESFFSGSKEMSISAYDYADAMLVERNKS